MGAGEVVEQIKASFEQMTGNQNSFLSEAYQWLPADIIVSTDGEVRFLSYINNVHSKWYAALYAATTQLLERTIPQFEKVSAVSAAPKHRALQGDLCDFEQA